MTPLRCAPWVTVNTACGAVEAWQGIAYLLVRNMHRTVVMPHIEPPAIEKKHLHFVGICGKAMGAIAAALANEGWRVTGSDEKCYQPMMNFLSRQGIPVCTPYAAGNVPPDADLVVVGKRVTAGNPELVHVLRHGPPHSSFPQFLHQHFLRHSRNAVVAGGVGKTTTTSMLAWILEAAGQRPDYLIGGLARNFPHPARFSGSRITVLEGDEYATCFDDPRPKFLHYQPEVGIITNIVEDHPDIYRNLGEVCQAFSDFIELLPAHGALIMADDDEAGIKLAQRAACQTFITGFTAAATERITNLELREGGSRFALQGVDFEIPLCGRMNVKNAAMAVLAASALGVPPEQAAQGLRRYLGVSNRQEERQIGTCTLVRDKASHPRALAELVGALRQRFPGRRLVSLIQPRATGGRDWVYQKELPEALAQFEKVILTSAHEHNPQQPQPWADDPFCLEHLGKCLRARMTDVILAAGIDEIKSAIATQIEDGDVIALTVLEQSREVQDVVGQALLERASLSTSSV